VQCFLGEKSRPTVLAIAHNAKFAVATLSIA
jgi:hypothetical protein